MRILQIVTLLILEQIGTIMKINYISHIDKTVRFFCGGSTDGQAIATGILSGPNIAVRSPTTSRNIR